MAKKSAPKQLRYPYDVVNYDTDYMLIRVVKYQNPGINPQREGGSIFAITSSQENYNNRKNKKLEGSIILPIPKNLGDVNTVEWNQSRLNSLAAAAFTTLEDTIDTLNLDDLKANFFGTLEAAGGDFQEAALAFGRGLNEQTQEAIKDAFIGQGINIFGANISQQELLSRENGVVLNPNMELLFRGVKLRQFQFEFDMTPRNRREGSEIKAIINTFKKRMAAKSATSFDGARGIFIGAPDVFEVQFKRGGDPHPFLFKMKVSALTDMKTNYTGTGNYITYGDGSPVKTNLSLTFQEINPVFAEDYDEDQELNEGVGF